MDKQSLLEMEYNINKFIGTILCFKITQIILAN